MYWLPPLNIKAKFDLAELCNLLLNTSMVRGSLKEAADDIEQRKRHSSFWSIGSKEERQAHLRKLQKLYHPDMYAQQPEVVAVMEELMKTINIEAEQVDKGIEADSGSDEEFSKTDRFKGRFTRQGKSTVQTSTTPLPIKVSVTLSQLYNREDIQISDTDITMKLSGDLDDRTHKLIKGRQIIIQVKEEPNMKKDGLDLHITVPTNPIQLLYRPEKITLPDGKMVIIHPGENTKIAGLGFKGKEETGNLIIDYKIMKMPQLTKEQQKKLHEINLEIFYQRKANGGN